MKHSYSLFLFLAFMASAVPSLIAQQAGCTDSNAANYDPNATEDDGSCYYNYYGCTDPNASNYDPNANVDDGSCYYYYGCTDPNAANYNLNANIDDGSCYYYGCTDQSAVNYDPNANVNDGSCYYEIYGCTNPGADNYDPFATVDDGSCYISGTSGCTDPNAANYNPWANYEDGSCYYYYYGCTDPNAVNYDFNANADDGSCYYYSYGCTDPNAVNYNSNANMDDGSCYYEYYDCYGDLNGLAIVDDCGTCAGGNTGVIACVLIGIEDSDVTPSPLQVYPNPSNGRFAITALANLGEAIAVQLTDVTGRVVQQQQWNASKGDILVVDTSLEDGMYLLNVCTESGKRFSTSVVISTN